MCFEELFGILHFFRHCIHDKAAVAPAILFFECEHQLDYAFQRPATFAGLGKRVDEDQLAGSTTGRIKLPIGQLLLRVLVPLRRNLHEWKACRRCNVKAEQASKPAGVDGADMLAGQRHRVDIETGIELAEGQPPVQCEEMVPLPDACDKTVWGYF